MSLEKKLFGKKSEVPKLREDIPSIRVQEGQSYEEEDERDPLWVDFKYGEDEEKGIKSDGIETFVISPITEGDLFSDKYINCTGVVGIGRDKITGKEIAFLSHQDPEYLLDREESPENLKKFLEEFKKTLTELVERSDEKTIEVALVGGNDDPLDSSSKKTSDYMNIVQILNEVTADIIGHKPTIVMDPNHGEGSIDITVVVQERKIIVV